MNRDNTPALQKSLSDAIMEYTEKALAADAEIAAYQEHVKHLETVSTVGGRYVPSHWPERCPGLNARHIKDRLLRSAWASVYAGLSISAVASAKDRKRFETMLENPPEFTLENIREQFGDFLLNPRENVLRGLAEAFTGLDPVYKSHTNVKIGVKGLPKRVIVNAVFSISGGSIQYGAERVKDVINALHVYRGQPRMTHDEWRAIVLETADTGSAPWSGGTIKRFANGNAHIMFDADALRDINLGLAEFYGDVLPDSPEASRDAVKRPGTAVSKDLAFYWTPPAVVEEMLSFVQFRNGDKILEPSCGDGRILDALRLRARDEGLTLDIMGVEYDRGRADQAKAKGHHVWCGNFLEAEFVHQFDVILMNPPFAGDHYRKHLAKAGSCLAPGGVLVSVLPASAKVNGDLGKLVPPDVAGRVSWKDLPLRSFSAAGTNVCTGLWGYRRRAVYGR